MLRPTHSKALLSLSRQYYLPSLASGFRNICFYPFSRTVNMHRCLEVDDIVHHLVLILSRRRERKSIATLARTCRTFHEPAMNALWRKLDGFGPLLECMPSDLFCERYVAASWAEPYLDVQAFFTRHPSDPEWNQVFKHAHRVKELTLGMGLPPMARHRSASCYSATVLSSILTYMRLRLQNEPLVELFPNLLVLRCRWHRRLQSTLECLPGLAGPLLRTVKIYGSAAHTDGLEPLDRFVQATLKAYPYLEDLSVVADSGPATQFQGCTTVLSDFISSASNLRLFRSNVPLTCKPIIKLVQMPYLSSLSIRLPDDLSWPDTRMCLASLKDIDIAARSLDTCTQFIAYINTNSLQSLDMQVQEPCQVYGVTAFFEALRQHLSLRRLRAFVDRTQIIPTATCTISGKTLALLYCLRDLEDILLEEHIGVDLCDRDVSALSKAWPSLRNLTFIGHSDSATPARSANVTLGGLMCLSRNCKHLRRLGLAFDASTIDVDLLAEATKAPSLGDNLYMLEVHAPLSTVTHPEQVAYYLHAIFPNLRILLFGASDPEADMDDGWARIWRIMTTLSCK